MTKVDMDTTDTSYGKSIGFDYDDIDLSEYSDEELISLGISEEEIKNLRGEEDTEEEEEEDTEETEEDSEEEEEEKEEEEEPKEKKKSEPRIPKHRFDEAVAKEREKAIRAEEKAKYLEQRIEELLALKDQITNKANTPEPEPEFDFEAAETQYAELLIEGEVKDAAALRVKIQKERDKYLESIVKSVRDEAKKASKELSDADKKELVIQEALTTYSFLNDKSDDYNDDLVQEINYLAAGYEARNKMAPAVALQKAIDRLAKPLLKVNSTKKRVEENRTKKAATMKSTPPNTSSSKSVKDKSADDFDWENMSQSEFEKLYKESPKLIKEAMSKAYI